MIRNKFKSFDLNTSEFETEKKVESSQSEVRHQGHFLFDIRVLPETLLYASLSLLSVLALKFKSYVTVSCVATA
jgi:hypothetical protein